MSFRRVRSLLVVVGTLFPVSLGAQGNSTIGRSGVYFESYGFGSGLAFDRISEFTIPISVTQRLGDRLVLDVGTAFASASVREADGTTIDHSGLVDTDLRATIGVIPGKLVFNLVGTIPTGATAVPDTTIPLFGATATDLLGFTTPSFGTGGGVSAVYQAGCAAQHVPAGFVQANTQITTFTGGNPQLHPEKSDSYTAGGVVRTWVKVSDFVQEVAVARIYDGVHYRSSSEVGTAMGQKIGALAAQKLPRATR